MLNWVAAILSWGHWPLQMCRSTSHASVCPPTCFQRLSGELDAVWRMQSLREPAAKRDIWKRKVEQVGQGRARSGSGGGGLAPTRLRGGQAYNAKLAAQRDRPVKLGMQAWIPRAR